MAGPTRQTNDDSARGSYLPKAPATELKGSVFTLTVLRLLNINMEAVEKELRDHLAQAPRFFLNAPVVIDVNAVKERNDIDFHELSRVLRTLNLIPVGIRNGTVALNANAVDAGIAVMRGGVGQDVPVATGAASSAAAAPTSTTDKPAVAEKVQESAPAPEPAPSAPAVNASGVKTKVIEQPIRSGQQIYAPDGDLIVLAAVNAGAEIIADGNIHVYAPLRGRALAGVKGDTQARIFCHSMEAELVAIAGHYQVFEEAVPDALRQKAVHVHLENDKLTISPLS